ncbi:MAG: putative multidrug export ATP-binding/permease protein [Chloroflexi bacterium ADurb.Bin325]|nr:MAG: putative multidrug export ATP-binding/permease protein [Chloroflexi bacterium ADurb.Bin325]
MATPTSARPSGPRPGVPDDLPVPDRAFFGQLFGHYRRLLVFVRPYWKLLLLAAVVLVLSSLAGLALPLAVRGVVDSALVSGNFALLNRVTLALVGLFVLQAVFGFAQSYIVGWVGERIVANLRETLYAHLQTMPLRFFAATRTGDLLSRLGNDVTTIQNAVTDVLLSLLSNIVMFVGGIVIISVMAWRLTLIMLAVVPLAVLGMILLGRLVRRISRQVQDTLAEVSATAEEAITGVRIVKSFAREPYEVDRYRDGTERLFGLAVKRVRLRATLGPVIGLLAYSSIALVLWFGSREVIAGNLTPGELVSFLLYTMMIASPIAVFTSLYSQFQQALGASERVFQLLDTTPELLDAEDAPEVPPIRGAVQFEHVCFDYGDTAEEHIVLRDIDLCVEPGQVVALVGPSGAGKTTLVNLIPRFYDPTEGRIFVDGFDIRYVKMRSLREQIGIVPQETALFSGTVRDNIAYGKLDATDAEIETAARAANAHDFISELPQGYATPVGERGVKLSGGQRQRVAIARALLKNPRILILDEATSSLDSESEQAVQEALERLMRDRTTFVIAHRLSTITKADWIVVLDGGRVVEQGRHAELVSQEGGLYRRMHALQFRWDGDPVTG